MDKEFFQALFKAKKRSYREMVKRVKDESVADQWGAGILGAYHLCPYASELIGHKPGKMLKGPSQPAKNRYQYFLNKDGKIIGAITYDEPIPAPDYWIHTDEFFEYHADHAVSYKFAGIGGADDTADLERIIYAVFERDQVTKTYSITDEDEYVEEVYTYRDGKIVEIEIKMWYEILYVRNFELKHEGDEVTIIEHKANGTAKQIYPELT